MKHSRVITLLMSSALCAPACMTAQTSVANISGHVYDPNNAIIVDAHVTLVNLATNEVRRQNTNRQGAFNFLAISPGRYRLRVTKESFSTIEMRSIALNVSDQREVLFHMKPGDVSTVVNVGSGAVVSTETSVSTSLDRTFVDTMPLNGRTFQNLIELAPGVVPSVGGPGQFTVNGMRSTENYFTVDGVAANVGISATASSTGPQGFSTYAGGNIPGFNSWGGTNSLLSVDALEEFKVDTANSGAEFGRALGGQVQLRSRSGSNFIHGSVSEFFRNEALNANDWFFNHNIDSTGKWAPLRKAASRLNNYGGTLGGPILKNKLFYFGSYEGMQTKQPTLVTSNSPMAYVRSTLTGSIKTLVDALPLPTGAEQTGYYLDPRSNTYVSGPLGYGSFSTSSSTINKLNNYSVRADYVPFSKLNLFVRYSNAPTNTGVLTGPVYLRSTSNIRFVTVGATSTFTSHLSNDLRLNVTRNEGHGYRTLVSSGGSTPFDYSAIAPGTLNDGNSNATFSIVGGSLSLGSSANNVMRQATLSDSVFNSHGRHTLGVGVDYRYLDPIFAPPNLSLGYRFDTPLFLNGFTATRSYRANGYVIPAGTTFGQGTLSGVTYSAGERVTTIQHNTSLFVTDNYQVTPRFLLTLGLRWEVNPPPVGTHSKPLYNLTGWTVGSTDYSQLALTAGAPVYPTRYNGFSPRVGISYMIHSAANHATVLHAAFARLASVGSFGAAGAAGYFPYYRAGTLTGAPGYYSFPLTTAQATPPSDYSLSSSLVGQTFSTFDAAYRIPYSYQESIGIQQQLNSSTLLNITYVGTNGRALLHQSIYQVPSTSGNAAFLASTIYANTNRENVADTSDYNALQVTLQRNLSRGLQFFTSYTWSHAFDTDSQSIGGLSTILNTSNPTQTAVTSSAATRGPSATDARNRLTFVATYQPLRVHYGDGFMGHVAGIILNDWNVSPTFTLQSGLPIDVYYSRAISSTQSVTLRPDRDPAAKVFIQDSSVIHGLRLNAAAFTIPATLRQGNSQRNSIQGFRTSTFDASLFRNFPIAKRVTGRLRADVFNVLNHPSFPNPNGLLGGESWDYVNGVTGPFVSNVNFGSLGSNTVATGASSLANAQASTGGLSAVFQSSSPRAIQLSIRLGF